MAVGRDSDFRNLQCAAGGEPMSGAALGLRRRNGVYYRSDRVDHAQSHTQRMVGDR
mgnify:CR=1 FL=1